MKRRGSARMRSDCAAAQPLPSVGGGEEDRGSEDALG